MRGVEGVGVWRGGGGMIGLEGVGIWMKGVCVPGWGSSAAREEKEGDAGITIQPAAGAGSLCVGTLGLGTDQKKTPLPIYIWAREGGGDCVEGCEY